MDFIRRRLFFLICGVAGAVGVALAVTGLGAMPKVMKQMKEVEALYNDINALKQKPVNEDMVEAARERVKRIEESCRGVMDRARSLYGYEPLVEGVFPNGDAETRLQFQQAYGTAMRELMNSLRWGEPATERDIEYMRQVIENEKYQRNLREKEGAPPPAAEPPATPAGVLTAAGVREDPVARAHLAAAQRIQCYAIDFFDAKPPERVASFQFEMSMRPKDSLAPPTLEECWRAQLGYWIQKDVADAVARVNEAAGIEARDREQDRWVGVMPVKEIVSVRVDLDFITEGEKTTGAMLAPPGGSSEAKPPGAAELVFTGSSSNDAYEVVQFTVKLVMDERDIPTFLEALCSDRFHTPLRVAYKDVPPNRSLRGKIYGPEPVVGVVMDFETILLGDVFRRWMPATLCEKFDINCPALEAKGGEEG